MLKSPLFILLLIFVVPVDIMAQEDKLKGPRAKNLKAWERKAAITTTIEEDKPALTGPSAKNTKVWDTPHTDLQSKVTIEVAAEKDQIHGVRAKNAKAWEDESVSGQQKVPRFIAPVLILLLLGL